jgi:hypothetical protein
MRTRVVI